MDKYIQTFLNYRLMKLSDFIKSGGDMDLYYKIQDSKMGYIKITKISDNPGYLHKGESQEGITAAFGEGIALYISNKDYWYTTSTVTHIDWDRKEFRTVNSKYSFEFTKQDINESTNTNINNASKGN